MIESCFMFACLARMRVPSFVFPGRLRFAGNIFMTRRGCLLTWPHVRTQCMCVYVCNIRFIRRTAVCISSRENTDRCTMQTEGARCPANRQKRRRKTVKRDRHRNLLFTAGLSQNPFQCSPTRTPLSRASRRWIRAHACGQTWEDIHV